jgi:23S rRNA (cytidine1920-2'-O)/16S rRNA (cytidine1409-2'-O)-methyltransferase
VARTRLDLLVVERGLAASRERARALVLAGRVRVDGTVVTKAGTPVDPAADVALDQPDHPYVGRGGLKLAHALDTFGIDVTGRLALDIGASTGGFTDAAPVASSPSTSVTGNWTGRCARILASPCWSGSMPAR